MEGCCETVLMVPIKSISLEKKVETGELAKPINVYNDNRQSVGSGIRHKEDINDIDPDKNIYSQIIKKR